MGLSAAIGAARQVIVAANSKTTGGSTPYKLISGATTNFTNVKSSAGRLYLITASNINAAVRYLKIYDKASAPGTGDVPKHTIALPGAAVGTEVVIPLPVGEDYALGIGIGITTGVADNDSGAVAANEIVVNLSYK